jgi:aminopeptidase YwaD
VEGEPWYQGDHGLFIMNQRPALAITSERVMELETNIVHTAKDRLEIVDPARLAEVALALRSAIRLW